MKNLFLNIIKSEIFRNTSILVSGTVLAQLIPILLQPILRRYYSVDDFGAYSIYLSLVSVFVSMASLKYELAIVLPKRDKESANVLFWALLSNSIFCILMLFIIFILKSHILELINLPDEKSIYLYLVPVGVFFLNGYQSINYWLIRKKGFFSISVNKFGRRGFEGAAQLSAIPFKISGGLLYGDIVGNLSNFFLGIFQCARKGFYKKYLSLVKVKYVLKKYSYFPLYNLVTGVMSAFSFSLPLLFINKFYSLEYTGFLDMTRMLLSIPLALVAISLANVILQRVSESYRNKRSVAKELLSIGIVIFVLAIVEIIVIRFWGVEIFTVFFGKQWEYSGEISKVLVLSYAFNFFVTTFNTIFIGLNRIKILSIWQAFYFFSILALSLLGNLSFMSFLQIYVTIEVLCSVVLIGLMVYIVTSYEQKIRVAR